MTRALTEFIFAQNVAWSVVPSLPGRPGVNMKVLSRDHETGEVSAIVRIPAGFTAVAQSPFHEELYVLDGALTLDGQALRQDCYAAVANGRPTSWQSQTGAVVLLWLDLEMEHQPGQLVVRDVLAMDWDDSTLPNADAMLNPRRKVLRADQDGHWRVFLLSSKPHSYPKGWVGRTLTHPCVEECFMLAGGYSGPHGVMTAGSYFWRPPEIPHGPFGGRDGALAIFRFMHGRHVNVWQDGDIPYRFDVPYRAVVPPEQAAIAKVPYNGAERY